MKFTFVLSIMVVLWYVLELRREVRKLLKIVKFYRRGLLFCIPSNLVVLWYFILLFLPRTPPLYFALWTLEDFALRTLRRADYFVFRQIWLYFNILFCSFYLIHLRCILLCELKTHSKELLLQIPRNMIFILKLVHWIDFLLELQSLL